MSSTLPLLFFLAILLTTTSSASPSQFLRPHNAARAALNLPALSWDPHLSHYAKKYSKQHGCAMVHSGGPYGENIFWGSGQGQAPARAVGAWVSERRWYRHATNACAHGEECGHYTQIIWRSTRRVGCAAVRCGGRRGGVFVACEYDPPGNYIGERPY